jgi:hypothetical protein
MVKLLMFSYEALVVIVVITMVAVIMKYGVARMG